MILPHRLHEVSLLRYRICWKLGLHSRLYHSWTHCYSSTKHRIIAHHLRNLIWLSPSQRGLLFLNDLSRLLLNLFLNRLLLLHLLSCLPSVLSYDMVRIVRHEDQNYIRLVPHIIRIKISIESLLVYNSDLVVHLGSHELGDDLVHVLPRSAYSSVIDGRPH